MLDYEWGNPSTVMLSPDNDPGSDPTRQHHNTTTIFDHYASQASQASAFNNLVPPPPPPQQQSHHAAFAHHFNSAQAQQLHSIYDAHAYANASAYAPPNHHPLLSLDPIQGGAAHGLILVPKSEDLCRPVDFASRIGLNLGGRTYFSSEDDFMNRLYRRTRPATETGSNHAPRCQAEGCTADLSHAKHYHRRHKVCEFHSKASTVIANGLTQRFCQQCSRFHLLPEFDNGKRSCRRRLADHNRRRRKTQQTNQENHNSQVQQLVENARNSSSDNVARSPPESAAHSASSVTVALSPPRMTLDCFRQRPYQAAATTSSGSSSSLFFSSG
ncbi:hypothetical protein PRUPE_2G134900 [Prunus persica]|uniref:SBP-type domain-containing protein n=1 Tax=Prunus persica TaxID=3760 RepID=M5X0V7_PRUPE|nr:squamosa promoter-binding-like protein 8 [Prunus persica]ONI22528.1 hypothetical protein PRUPE_2G134900 [Prunus persica]ONI22529.1 hypothetical protein PRUPE_2G134900 [Prunus persica]